MARLLMNGLERTFPAVGHAPPAILPSFGALTIAPKSQAGDHILFEAEMDLIVALTACSALQSNNYAFKPIHYGVEA